MSKNTWDLLFLGALACVIAVSVVGTALFVAQGGFGGGHGRYDRFLFLLGLPWVLIPSPGLSVVNDYLRLVILPLGFNVSALVVIRFIFSVRK